MTDAPQPDAAHERVISRRSIVRLLAYARPYLGLIALAMILAWALSIGHYGRAYLIKPIFDDVIAPSQSVQGVGNMLPVDLGSWIPGSPAPEAGDPGAADEPDSAQAQLERITESMATIIAAALLIVFAMPILHFGREYLVAWVMGRIDLDMKQEICGHLLALPLRFHQESNRGDLFARMIGDSAAAQGALGLLFGDLIEAVVMLLVGAAALLFVSWQLSLVMLLVGPGIFLIISVFGRRIRKSAKSRQLQAADVTGRLLEILEGIKVIKAFRAEGHEMQGFRAATRGLFRRGMKVVKNRVLARSLIDGLNNLAAIGVLLLGLFLVVGGYWNLTMGDLAAFSAISVTLYRPVRTLARGWVRVVDAQPSAERYFEVLDNPLDLADAADAVSIPRIQQGIRFAEVDFSYGREPVLVDVDFEVRAGEVVAIVGRTGAGKTTLADLLLRFYDPTDGRIEIDGVDLRRVRRDTLLDQMAVVTQEPFLFDGTIGDNIRYGRHDATEEEVLAAARTAHVDEFVDDLDLGYDTVVGAGGARLSGGQRQRVTIARALLRDPAILVLDEATSSLDSKSERLVQDAIERLLPGRTAFVIAHRLSTIRSADQVVVLERGRVAQFGPPDELARKPGLYRDLLSLQTADAPETTG